MRPPQTWKVGRTLGFARTPDNKEGFGIVKPLLQGSRESQRSAHSPSLGVDAST